MATISRKALELRGLLFHQSLDAEETGRSFELASSPNGSKCYSVARDAEPVFFYCPILVVARCSAWRIMPIIYKVTPPSPAFSKFLGSNLLSALKFKFKVYYQRKDRKHSSGK